MAKKYGKTYQEVFEVEDEPQKTGFFTKVGIIVALAIVCSIIGFFSSVAGWIVFAIGAVITYFM